MGSQKQHREKADRIQQFADSIGGLDFPEWIAIALFYKALHCVEMMLAVKSEHTTTHNQRRELLRSRYPEILREYKPLYNYSLLCRYRFFEVDPQRDLQNMKERLSRLEKYVNLEIQEA